jgi:uncharacterized repeat protein (TIGR03803 family)
MRKAAAARRATPALVLSTLLLTAAHAATVTTLYRFPGGAGGSQPMGPLITDAQGNLYGVTMQGGVYSYGVIYRLAPPTQPGAPWTETILHNFKGTKNGVDPIPPLAFDANGNLVGTT